MAWTKERHGATDYGYRREDNLAYVGKSRGGWWRAWVRIDATDAFELLDSQGSAAAQSAMRDADALLEGLAA